MIERLTEIAPLASWAMLAGATALYVAAVVAYSHGQTAWRAFGERFAGPAAAGTVPSMARWSLVLLSAATALFGILLGWSTLAVVILCAAASVPLAVEVAVRLLG